MHKAFAAANAYMGVGTLAPGDVTVTVSADNVKVTIKYDKEPLVGLYIKDDMLDNEQCDDADGVEQFR